MPSSDNIIFQESLVNPVIGTQIMGNPSGLSKSLSTSKITGPHKRVPTCLNNSVEDVRRKLSAGASCSSAIQSSMYRKRRCDYVPTIANEYEQAAKYLDMGNNFKRRRLSNGVSCSSASQHTCGTACCSTVENINGHASDLQYVPAQIQPHDNGEQEDQDDTIYMPMDCFPVVQGRQLKSYETTLLIFLSTICTILY